MTIKVLSLDIARCPGWWGTHGWKQWQLLVKVCVEMLANEVERGNAPKALDSLCEHAFGVSLSRCLWSGKRPSLPRLGSATHLQGLLEPCDRSSPVE